jgi:hypothetical protein
MAKFIITDRSGLNSEYRIEKERVSIGRFANNDIVLNDNAVSGRHALFSRTARELLIEDLDSTNGTHVDGRPIRKQAVEEGQEIGIGRNVLRFVAENSDAHDQTMMLQAADLPVPEKAPPRASTGKPLRGKLRVVSGSGQGKELELIKALTTVGKPGVQVAALTKRADGYYIVNVAGGSAPHRPLVNGKEIGLQAHVLHHGDRIELAGTQMEFSLIAD